MKPFTRLKTTLLPLDRSHVDTDAIIPQQYLKSVKRTGFGKYLFDNWRYLDPGTLDTDPGQRRTDPDFVLNHEAYAGAEVLLVRENFGCGSSREHAVWSLLDYGFRAVIASSFADIFCSNSYKNGLLPITLQAGEVDELFDQVAKDPAYACTLDLEEQVVRDGNDRIFSFEISAFHKHCLLNGYDEIDITLQHEDKIRAYEDRMKQTRPWLFP